MLCWRCPELLPVLQDHLATFDQLLPHVLMGDITRWAVRQYRAEPTGSALINALAVIEEAMSASQVDVSELISVSFLENLPTGDEPGARVITMLGPELRAELQRRTR